MFRAFTLKKIFNQQLYGVFNLFQRFSYKTIEYPKTLTVYMAIP